MLSKQSAERIASEAHRLIALTRDARDSEGVYATDHDLKELVKSLSYLGKRKTAYPASSLGRKVADFARPESKLFRLVLLAIEECENEGE